MITPLAASWTTRTLVRPAKGCTASRTACGIVTQIFIHDTLTTGYDSLSYLIILIPQI